MDLCGWMGGTYYVPPSGDLDNPEHFSWIYLAQLAFSQLLIITKICQISNYIDGTFFLKRNSGPDFESLKTVDDDSLTP